MLRKSTCLKMLASMALLFFIWGVVTSLNDILVPYFKNLFDLDYFDAMLVPLVFFGAFGVFSPFAAKVIRVFSYKSTMLCGLLLGFLGSLVFIFAAHIESYPVFLFGVLVLASGVVFLQVSVNPYVTLLGNPKSAALRLTVTGGMNPLGATLAPQVATLLILSTVVLSPVAIAALSSSQLAAYHLSLVNAIQVPYLILAGIFLVLIVFFSVLKFPHLKHVEEQDKKLAEQTATHKGSFFSTLKQYPHLMAGAVAVFLLVGAEVSTSTLTVNYLELKHVAGLNADVAGYFVSVFWGGMMIGRFLSSWVLRKIKPNQLIFGCASILTILVLLTTFASGLWAVVGFLGIGFFSSALFPTIFSLAIEDTGADRSFASGLLCGAIFGGALIPLLQGLLADVIGLQYSFGLLLAAFVFIIYFALHGYQLRNRHFKSLQMSEVKSGC